MSGYDWEDVDSCLLALKGTDEILHVNAAQSLVRLGDKRAVGPLIDILTNADEFNARARAAWALGGLEDSRAFEPLSKELKNPNSNNKPNAAQALGMLGDTRAVEPLIGALKDADWAARRSAANALGMLGDTRAVEPLIGLLKNDADVSVRTEAARNLGQLGDPRAFEPLIETLKDADEEVRRWAAASLGHLGDSRAFEPLIETLKDASERVRNVAAISLGRLGDARAVEPLIETLKDAYSEVRRFSADALGMLGDARAIEPLIGALKDRSEHVCWSAAQALRKLGVDDPNKGAAEAVGSNPNDPNAIVRRSPNGEILFTILNPTMHQLVIRADWIVRVVIQNKTTGTLPVITAELNDVDVTIPGLTGGDYDYIIEAIFKSNLDPSITARRESKGEFTIPEATTENPTPVKNTETGDSVPPAINPPEGNEPETTSAGDDSSFLMQDSVVAGDALVGSTKIESQTVNDPEAMARVAVEAYRMARSEEED